MLSHQRSLMTGIPALVLVCIAAVLVAGCTAPQPPVGATPTESVTLSPVVAGTSVVSPSAAQDCTRDEDCVPAGCCHPTRCIPAAEKGVCNEMCTLNCAGPLDCGAGSCGCVRGTCAVVPAGTSLPSRENKTSLRVTASPQRYSPLMSSTPGIGLTPAATGFTAADAVFSWNATQGEFLSWSAPDYTVTPLKSPVTNHGDEIYWSFTGKSASSAPVIITVVAEDPGSGTILGTSRVTLAWDGDYAVTVQDIR
jgi:hypothetical protein